jgi:hypothetical protein
MFSMGWLAAADAFTMAGVNRTPRSADGILPAWYGARIGDLTASLIGVARGGTPSYAPLRQINAAALWRTTVRDQIMAIRTATTIPQPNTSPAFAMMPLPRQGCPV